MTGSTNQQGESDIARYDTMQERMVDKKPDSVLVRIKPMTEDDARRWLGASNRYGSKDVVEHFAGEVRRLQE